MTSHLKDEIETQSVVTEEEFADVVRAIHKAVKTGSCSKWYPKVVRREEHTTEDQDTVYITKLLVDGHERGTGFHHAKGEPEFTEFDRMVHEAQAVALLRLVTDRKMQCALFAMPAFKAIDKDTGELKCGVDAVVGFVRGQDMTTFKWAWDGVGVFPMITVMSRGNFAWALESVSRPDDIEDDDVVYVICAALAAEARHRLALFRDNPVFTDVSSLKTRMSTFVAA